MNCDLLYNPELIGANLRLLRASNEITLLDAATAAGLSKAFLSMVETGKRNIKFPDLRRLLQSYKYSAGRFFSEALDEESDIIKTDTVVRKKSQFILLDGTDKESEFHISLMRPLRSPLDVEFLEIYIPPKREIDYEIVVDAEIRGIVQKGTLLIDFKNDEFIAYEGEEFCFDGKQAHVFRNHTSNPVCANLIIYPPNF